jgi:glycosyltransferase involved in cell wall biosynthesis
MTKYSSVYERIYRFTRQAFNNPLLARQILRSRRYLEWSTSSYAKKLEKILKSIDVDVVLAIHHIAAAAYIKIRDKIGVPLVFDHHGMWSEEIIASGTLERNTRQARNVQEFESRVLLQADFLTTTGEELKTYLVEHFGIDASHITPILPGMNPLVEDAKKVLEPSRIVFAGTATYRERIDLLLQSMSFVFQNHPSAELYMTRKGDALKPVERLAKQLKVSPNYFYFPSRSDFYNFLKDCHIGVITSSDELTRRLAHPAKIYDYMAVGLPMVANDVGAWTSIIRDSKCGILTDSTPEGLAKGMLELLQSPELIYEMGKNGLDFLRSVLKPDKLVKDFYDALLHASQTHE